MDSDNNGKPRIRREVTDEEYQKVTTEQFAELGKFVQEFEELVETLRSNCQGLFPVHTTHIQPFVDVFLYHPVMTARPLFDCMRALYAESLEQRGESINEAESNALRSILKQMANSIQELVERRNSLLHGYWLIGRHVAGDDISNMHVSKRKTSKSGVSFDFPIKNIDELRTLRLQCAEMKDMAIQLLGAYEWGSWFGTSETRIRATFVEVEGRWQLRKRLNPAVTGS